jgi:hypothetical protein
MSTDHRIRLAARAVVVAFLLVPSSLFAQKTDVISLDNGSSVVGEIKELERGRLRVKLYAAGTAYVEWEHVTGVTTDKFLEVELVSGARVYGSIGPSDVQGSLKVLDGNLDPDLPINRIVRIVPIKSTFWSRTAGSVDFGFSFTKANRNVNYTLRGNVDYRSRNWVFSLTGDSYLQRQNDTEEVTRNNARLQGGRLLKNRWTVSALVAMEQNSELELDVRSSIGAGPGRTLIQSNRIDWGVIVALAASREKPTGQDPFSSLEFLAATDFRWFLFGDHKTDLRTSVSLLPSLTEWGRMRINIDTSFKRDLIKDLYLSLTFWDDYDSGAGIDGMGVNDLGLTFGVGYSW